jgi:hypothetical protein
MKLKQKYRLSGCCSPAVRDEIVGYFSYDDHIKVHRSDCGNLAKTDPERLVSLTWPEILEGEAFEPDTDYRSLEGEDFAILRHHREFDIDYSLKVARLLGLEKQEVFDRHQKLRNLGLLERVEALLVQYRKKVVRNKWIKHRNHTYYRLTEKGARYLNFYDSQPGKPSRD